MRAVIEGIAAYLPERHITNEALGLDNPTWDMAAVAERTGVRERYFARPDETAFDLGLAACRRLLDEHADLRERIDAVIFCTQSGDYVMPPNSALLHGALELREDVLAFDTNLACSGFVYGLGLAHSLIAGGLARCVLLVNADTYSRFIHPQDRSARVLFGDGAAATVIEAKDGERGIVDVLCATAGRHYAKFIIPAGGCRAPRSDLTARPVEDSSGNIRTDEHIHMDGLGILSFVNSRVPPQVKALLAKHELKVDDIDLFVFHQASKPALDSLHRLLRIPPERSFANLATVGNTVSASIPIALRQAIDEGRAGEGSRIVVCGFGVGLSWASALVVL